jgi:hypothetical protein
MQEFRQSRVRFAVIALLALLVMGTTLVGVWHQHNGAPDANCCFCHLSHQPVEPSLATGSEPALLFTGFHHEAPAPLPLAGPAIRQLPARAPPAV